MRELQAAEAAQQVALAAFSIAERRYFALSARKGKLPPDWYRTACRDVASAGRTVDALYRRIAATSAAGRRGMLAKARLLAIVYGLGPERPAKAGERDDLVAILIRSLIADLGVDSGRRR